MVKMQKNAKRFCAVLLALGVLNNQQQRLCFLPRDLYSAVRIRRKGGIGTPTEEGDFLDDHHGLE